MSLGDVKTFQVFSAPDFCSSASELTAFEYTLNAFHLCRRPSSDGFQLKCRGGLMAAEAVALLKEFYATGNPKGAQPYSQG